MKYSFSSEVVDLNIQAPNRNKRESKYFWDEFYTWVSAAGFEYLEMPYEAKWDFGGRSGIPRTARSIKMKFGNAEGYIKFLNENGIKGISAIHMDPSLFCGDNVMMYFGAFGHYAEEAVEYAAAVGADVVTLTVTPNQYSVKKLMENTENGVEVFLQKTAELIENLADKAADKNVKLCLKNEFWSMLRGEAIVDFVKGLNKKVYIDADTANLKIAGVDPTEFIEKYSDLIGVVHFTDTFFVDDQDAYSQSMPEYPAVAASKVYCDIGQGDVDFARITEALKKAGYDGNVVCSCKDSYDICRSILRTAYTMKNSLAE